MVGLVWGKANHALLPPLVCYLLSPPRRELPRGNCLGHPVAAERTLEISQARYESEHRRVIPLAGSRALLFSPVGSTTQFGAQQWMKYGVRENHSGVECPRDKKEKGEKGGGGAVWTPNWTGLTENWDRRCGPASTPSFV